MGKVARIFDVIGEKGQSQRGFLDMETQEIVIYDDKLGKELFRIGNNGQNNNITRPNASNQRLTTLTFVITNGSDTKQTATLFAANFEPLIQPLGISVIIKEIEQSVFNSHNYLRRDILSNKLKIRGFTYIVENTEQFNNDLYFGNIKTYGVIETKPFSPLSFLSTSQYQSKVMDISKNFKWEVNSRSILYVPVEARSSVTLMFNVIEEIDSPITSNNNYNSFYNNNNKNLVKQRERTPIVYNGNASAVFQNANSGGLGSVKFNDYGNIDIDDSFSNIDGEDDKSNQKKGSSFVGNLVKVSVCVVAVYLAIKLINKIK